MSAATLNPRMRNVFDAPRGRRFAPGAAVRRRGEDPWFSPRGRAMLAQMRGNPRVEYRIEHGPLPPWMNVTADRPDRSKHGEGTRRCESPGRHRKQRGASWWLAASHGLAVVVGVTVGQVAFALL
ncbi:hypothetical protein AB0I72_11750 [Nocardiopsis sp. NPDC049922]|uniref:hypothetical protein n=1 Tax=Nocardiopsis sp. NPDC049922 TaxID=3155157 RepID=UPI0034036757